MQRILIVTAVPEEMIDIPAASGIAFDRCVTGVGKVQAMVNLVAALDKSDAPYDAVLNIGTAGAKPSSGLAIGDIVTCTQFEDRDMRQLADYGTKYLAETEIGTTPTVAAIVKAFRRGKCNTGDTFVTSGEFDGDVCDMEGFALATLANSRHIPFVAVKYVTDIIGSNSVNEWEAMLSRARTELSQRIDEALKSME